MAKAVSKIEYKLATSINNWSPRRLTALMGANGTMESHLAKVAMEELLCEVHSPPGVSVSILVSMRE